MIDLNDPNSTNSNVRNQRLGRGINMGNMLEAPRGGWNSENLELKPEYFAAIYERGFDSVRIPIRWSDYADKSAPYTVEPDFLAKVDSAIQAALGAHLAVVINMHHYEEIFADPIGEEPRLLGIWEQIANRYKENGPDLVYEVLNEPHGQLNNLLWSPLLKRAVQVIRNIDRGRQILAGPAEWNSIAGLQDFEPPDTYGTILTVHYYLPMQFTHQGAGWVEGSDAWLGTTWEGTPDEQRAVTADFDLADAFARAHNMPVNLGEFGAYERGDLASRVRWTDFVARQAEERGWSFHYWEFCAGFGAYDREKGAWREELAKALVPEKGVERRTESTLTARHSTRFSRIFRISVCCRAIS